MQDLEMQLAIWLGVNASYGFSETTGIDASVVADVFVSGLHCCASIVYHQSMC
jgi:hypothetical protein